MTSIAVRRDPSRMPTTATKFDPRLEPARFMRDLMSWDPFREMTPFVQDSAAAFIPSFEVKETKDGYLFKADVPGVKESDLEVSVTGNRLTVSGKRESEKEEQSDTYFTYERSYGTFSRSFTLPDGVDMNGVNADLKDGVLTLSLKKSAAAQPRKIPVQTPAKQS